MYTPFKLNVTLFEETIACLRQNINPYTPEFLKWTLLHTFLHGAAHMEFVFKGFEVTLLDNVQKTYA